MRIFTMCKLPEFAGEADDRRRKERKGHSQCRACAKRLRAAAAAGRAGPGARREWHRQPSKREPRTDPIDDVSCLCGGIGLDHHQCVCLLAPKLGPGELVPVICDLELRERVRPGQR